MANNPAVYQEFLSRNYGWCKAYFMTVDRSEDGAIHQVELAIELIDEAKRREKQLLYLSETDAMTKLRNRGSGERAITDLVERGTEGMFCLLDADKFKSINDTFGHDAGDIGERKITISLGAAIFRVSDNCDFSELYKRADSAAYQSKKVAGNFCTFFND